MGSRDQKVAFWRRDETARNAFNEPVTDWLLLGAAYADRRDLSDADKMAVGSRVAATVARFKVRSNAMTRGLMVGDQLRRGGEVWRIIGAKDVPAGRRRLVEVTAEMRSDTAER